VNQSGPDVAHLQLRQADGTRRPVVTGTSFGGVIRQRARRIALTLLPEAEAIALVNNLFGYADQDDDSRSKAGRVRVRDTVLDGVEPLVQNRIRVDRFTGGAHTTALFSEAPVFGGAASRLTLDLQVINPIQAEIGLLLQVLKDLWCGDLAIGGESSVGRGRLQGIVAELHWQTKAPAQTDDDQAEPAPALATWRIEAGETALNIDGDRQRLEACAAALVTPGGTNHD
jgi:CRISPR/Cas system CMR subunit Cmr4 (Cas7 group RAMP superfamily)